MTRSIIHSLTHKRIHLYSYMDLYKKPQHRRYCNIAVAIDPEFMTYV